MTISITPNLLNIIRRGYYIFPISRNTKSPIITDNLNRASCDSTQVMKWAMQYPNCNWGLSLAKSGLVCVDVDVKHGGMEAWEAIKEEVPKTLTATSGGRGKHFVFKSRPGIKYIRRIQDGIDIQFNAYIAIEPSIHPTGRQYTWDDITLVPEDYPEWLATLIERKAYAKPSLSPTYKFGQGHLKKLVGELKKFELNYHEWVQAGMAIHAMKSDEGWDAFLELTTDGPSYVPGDEDLAVEKWESFTHDKGITIRTLGHLIRSKGGVVPTPFLKEDIDAMIAMDLEKNKVEEEQEGWKSDGFTEYSRNADWIVDQINSEGYAFYSEAIGQNYILKISNPGRGRLDFTSQSPQKINFDYENKCFRYSKVLATSIKIVDIPAIQKWAGSMNRSQINRITFDPKGKEQRKGILNIYQGIPHEAKPGDCAPILRNLEESLCDGNTAVYNWLMDFVAHIVQKPWEKPTVVPVIIGEQGTGKGLLTDHIMSAILKDLYFAVPKFTQLASKFNSFLSNRLLINLDEATWSGNKEEDGFLKNIIGSEYLNVEEKFGGVYRLPNFFRMIITSNNEEAVAISKDNRRYAVIECNKKYAKDTKYFGPVFDGVREGKWLQEFLWFLKERDISKFNPYHVPDYFLAGKEAKIKTDGPVATYFENLFEASPQKLWSTHKGKQYLNLTTAYSFFKDAKLKGDWNLTQIKFSRKAISLLNLGERYSFKAEGLITHGYPITPKQAYINFCHSLKFPPDNSINFEELENLLVADESAF